MIIDDLHASPWIFDDCCRWYVRLQEQLLQRVCSCCKQGRMAQRYIQSTMAQLKRSAKNINLQQPATFTASGRVWKTTCFETAVAVHRELGCWWLLRSRATWIWPWSWSITPSLKPNSCDYFQCEACNIEFIHVFHDPTTDSPRTVSETFGDQSTTEFQIVEATASFSERERETPKRHVGLHQIHVEHCGTWHADYTCGILWGLHFINHRSAPRRGPRNTRNLSCSKVRPAASVMLVGNMLLHLRGSHFAAFFFGWANDLIYFNMI